MFSAVSATTRRPAMVPWLVRVPPEPAEGSPEEIEIDVVGRDERARGREVGRLHPRIDLRYEGFTSAAVAEIDVFLDEPDDIGE